MKRILVVGDAMFDVHNVVRTTRVAEEADVPIWDIVSRTERPGGGANLACAVKSLGGDDVEVTFAGIYDETMYDMLRERGIESWQVHGRCLTKCRCYEGDRLVFRIDDGKFDGTNIHYLEETLSRQVSGYDAVVVSDYDKGSITGRITTALMDVPLRVVDSKRRDLKIFRNFDILKVNRQEDEIQASMSYGMSYECFFKNVVVTMGAGGAELRKPVLDGFIVGSEIFPAVKTDAVDVVGCGDVHTAAMTIEMLRSRDIRRAIKFANYAAAKKVAVTMAGCPPVTDDEWKGERA